MQLGRMHAVSRHAVRQDVGMQIGRIHALSRHAVRQEACSKYACS